MPRRDLQIQTNFLDGDDGQIESIRHQKTEIVEFMQKRLSCILARNFILCWEQLKDFGRRTNSFEADLYAKWKNYSTSQLKKEKSRNLEIEPRSFSKKQSRQRLYTGKAVYMVESYVEDNKKSRTKSYIKNPYAGEQRANVIKQIVQKLKKNSQADDISSGNLGIEVLRKVSRLQKMMKQIKRVNLSENSYLLKQETKKQKEEDNENMRIFIQQIRSIRKEIDEIKQNNQNFIKEEQEIQAKSRRANQNRNDADRPKSYSEINFIEQFPKIHQSQFQNLQYTNNPNTITYPHPSSITSYNLSHMPVQPRNIQATMIYRNAKKQSDSMPPNIYTLPRNNPVPQFHTIHPSNNNNSMRIQPDIKHQIYHQNPMLTYLQPPLPISMPPHLANNSQSNRMNEISSPLIKLNSTGNISTNTTFVSFPSTHQRYRNPHQHFRNPSIENKYQQLGKNRQEEEQDPKRFCDSCHRDCRCRPQQHQQRQYI